MSDKPEESRTKQVPLRNLRTEEIAEDLLDSPAMEPYIRLALAMELGADLSAAVTEIAALPLESRYVWRIASALKWTFADFDTVNVAADRKSISADDRNRLADLLQHRPLQFCLFLSALFGEKQMELLIGSAIRQAREVAKLSNSAGHG